MFLPLHGVPLDALHQVTTVVMATDILAFKLLQVGRVCRGYCDCHFINSCHCHQRLTDVQAWHWSSTAVTVTATRELTDVQAWHWSSTVISVCVLVSMLVSLAAEWSSHCTVASCWSTGSRVQWEQLLLAVCLRCENSAGSCSEVWGEEGDFPSLVPGCVAKVGVALSPTNGKKGQGQCQHRT